MRLDFGDRIRKLRESRRLTQVELGRMLNVSKSVISAYENGQYLPKHNILWKIAKQFGVSMDYLYGMDKAEPETNSPDMLLHVKGLDEEQLHIVSLVVEQFARAGRNPGEK